MGRKRKVEDQWLPPRVYRGKSAFEFRPADGGCIRLCPLSASQRAVWRRYEEEMSTVEIRSGSFAHLAKDFLESKAFKDLSPRTRKDYLRYSEKVIPVFGKMSANGIKPVHIRQYMDKRGEQTEVQANREHSFMSKVFSWGYERGRVSVNPCLKVRKFTEESRTRYITDDEYLAVLNVARPLIRAAMEISYCCAARQGDVLNLTRDQLLEEGIFIKQGKTSKAQIKRWSDRLRSAIDTALSFQKVKNLKYVMAVETGEHLTGHKLRQWYREAKRDAEKNNPHLSFDFTFHDIKAKAISDYEGDKQKFSGHKTAAQVAVYDRKVEVSDTHN
ncbi:tyrosine-type recombinase/integrase [Neptunomonas sp.]|uniref:phage integrase central domain-containing protein n=1 Tax=Neptunomonas TaxID=75687 RepID=UPI00351803BF